MGSQVAQGDSSPAALRHSDLWRQVPGHGIVECDLAALNHVRQQQASEYFRERADLEYRVAVDRPAAAPIDPAVGHQPPPVRVDDARDHADTLLVGVDPIDEDASDV